MNENKILNKALVIDNGTGISKNGLSGEDQPRSVFPTMVGRPKYGNIMPELAGYDREWYIGQDALELKGVLKLNFPIEHGTITDWPSMERIWHYTFYSDLRVDPSEHPVLLTEAPLNPRANREKMTEIMFKTFNIPALYVATQAVLSLYASGRVTGVVIDIGDGVSHIVPIYEGFALGHAIQRIDLAGRDITRYLKRLLRQRGVNLGNSAEFEMLPDGETINVGVERFLAPECFFNPSVIGKELDPIDDLIVNAVNECDVDLRRDLFSNIVLSGGSTMFPGIKEG